MLALTRKFLALDRERKRLLLEAWVQLGVARTALARRRFRDLVAGLSREEGAGVEMASAEPAPPCARHIGWAVMSASRFTPWQNSCLVQVLAAQRMLRKRAIPGVIYIGASRGGNEAESPDFAAHAWLKCGRQFITGEAGHERYGVITSFRWGP